MLPLNLMKNPVSWARRTKKVLPQVGEIFQTSVPLLQTPLLIAKGQCVINAKEAQEAYAVMKELQPNLKPKDDCNIFGQNVASQLCQITDICS